MPVDLTPPDGVRSALRRGLRLHEQGRSGDGLKPETVAWARRMAGGEAASEAKVREMSAWHKRHKASKSPGWDAAGKEKPGFVAFLLWGGEPGESWADRKVAEMDRKEADGSTRAATPAVFTRAVARKANPDALRRADPIVVLRVGVVRDLGGVELDGNVTDRAQLEEMVKFFERVQKPTGELPLIDMNHSAVGPMSFAAHPEATIPIGAVLEMRVVDDDIGPALEVVPGYTKRGREYIDAAEGLLYVSATYRLSPTTDRMNAEPVAGAALLAFALTATPATRVDQLGEVRSIHTAGTAPAKGGPMTGAKEPDQVDAEGRAIEVEVEDGGEMTPEEKQARIDALKAELAMLEGDGEAERAADPTPGPAAEAFASRLVSERSINPADRKAWAVRFERDPAKAMAEAPKSGAAYRGPTGSVERPKPGLGRSPSKAEVEAHIRTRAREAGSDYMTARGLVLKERPELKKVLEVIR